MQAIRTGGRAPVADAEATRSSARRREGSMAESNGRPIQAPLPRKNVRREIDCMGQREFGRAGLRLTRRALEHYRSLSSATATSIYRLIIYLDSPWATANRKILTVGLRGGSGQSHFARSTSAKSGQSPAVFARGCAGSLSSRENDAGTGSFGPACRRARSSGTGFRPEP